VPTLKGRVASTANHRLASGSRGRPRPPEGLYKSVTRRVETRRVSHTRVGVDKLDILVEYRQVVNTCGRSDELIILVSDRRVRLEEVRQIVNVCGG